MKVVILAGGLGSRLAEETVIKPKPLVEIGDKPIIWHIMNIYAHHGLKDFIVCVGYKGYLLKEYFSNIVLHHNDFTVDLASNTIEYHNKAAPDWRVTLVDTGLTSMTGGRLRNIRQYLDPNEPFCMTYGDGVGDIDITAEIEFHQQHGLKATMCTVVPPARFGAIHSDGYRVTEFREKPQSDGARINGGFFVLHPSVLDLIKDENTSWENEPLEALATSGQLAAFIHDGFWQPMDTLRERTLLEELWRSGKAPWKIWD
ncbi:glucose-1-phosphate cytidylyltransferase [Pectobacterium punjabense]|uniref:Glucose-1-phosphate cytidylyltransferase n=1 Tax=Pectobacterium punjabense TaxID=2108399 RepID=A0ABX6L3G7_9GAMM|nr:glucose-1-phosphate cytidylyltransferase [Pectobacterium punjabense]MBN3137855.1 glucose-1-phosphate cytidylyltransferase [Pectobacterium punjabense]MBS4431584.1 glucose-1-phosphate cytidylyltransferase [Pectobacterium punjabense]MCE5379760.1 glucose-1-phosphate cytidylyltransferase [Pectobacterium punjabense]PTA66238.1 glucose-1-phosphate cytidylyltransferase [Pectobacterium punjabense]QJA20846.1 glucose-1-phosphate cytidylyltransferase [Pectobacterium punjabense]